MPTPPPCPLSRGIQPTTMPRPLLCALLALATAGAAATATPAADATVSFTLDHNLGPGGAWTPAGTLAGSLGAALTAARAGRGVVPGLTLTRTATALSAGETAALQALIAQGGLYKVRATADGAAAAGAALPTTPLVASAPAACVAGRGGDAPLKLDGALTLYQPGDFSSPEALQISGLTFDFLGGEWCGVGGRSGNDATPPPAWAPPASSPVLLWLPAAAPPVLPAPEPVDRRRGNAAAPSPLARAVGGGGGGGEEGEADGEEGADKKAPPSWIQRNFIYVLPLTMVVVNMMQAAGAPAAAERQQQQQQGRGGGRVREE